jgi:ADP-heptose:LPS heptosyltransferase
MTAPRVLVARLDAAGDVLLAGPAVRAVAYHRNVVMLVGPRGKEAAALLPGVDAAITWAAPWIEPTAPAVRAVDVGRFTTLVRHAHVDEAVILTSFHQSALPLALLLRMSGIARITGVSADYPGSLLDVRVPEPGDMAESERGLLVARAAGYVPHRSDDGSLAVRRPLRVTTRLTGHAPYVVLHPGTSAPARAWPVSRWKETARALVSRGQHVVVTGSHAERLLTREVAVPGAVDLGGATTMAGLAGVLGRAKAVVVGNTGPAHLAAAVGTPVVSLFAPTVPAGRWAPYGVRRRILGDQDAPCSGTRATSCPVEGHPCLTEVRARDVLDALDDLLGLVRS